MNNTSDIVYKRRFSKLGEKTVDDDVKKVVTQVFR